MRVDKRECSGNTCCTWYECDVCRRVRLTTSLESTASEGVGLTATDNNYSHYSTARGPGSRASGNL